MNKKSFNFLVLIFLMVPLFSFAETEQEKIGKFLNINKSYIDYANVGISNFRMGDNDQFFQIYNLHFNADIAFLQSDYNRAVQIIKKSQKLQSVYYADFVEKFYLGKSKEILDEIAPVVIKSKSQKGRLYLNLGYRDRAIARNYQKIAIAGRPILYSYKIGKYLEAVKLSRRSIRYSFLALFESQDIMTKQKIYNHLIEMEREKGNLFYLRFLNKTEEQIVAEIDKNYSQYNSELSSEEKELLKNETHAQKRSRFRDEQKTALAMVNGHFEAVENYMRKYIDDFNFQIILASFEILEVKSKVAENDVQNANMLQQISAKDLQFNYSDFRIHHYDNYQRIKNKQSLLDVYASKIEVNDYSQNISSRNIENQETKKVQANEVSE